MKSFKALNSVIFIDLLSKLVQYLPFLTMETLFIQYKNTTNYKNERLERCFSVIKGTTKKALQVTLSQKVTVERDR
jgi:hypothetical protein